MKEIRSTLLPTLLLCFTLLFLIGCEDKKREDPFISVENTTELFTAEDRAQQKEKIQRIETEEEYSNEEISIAQVPLDTVILADIQENTHILNIKDQKIIFQDINQSVVLLHFFSTWCVPCVGEIPYLSDLQKKYKKDLLIVGILVNDSVYDDTLKIFISKNHANYFISNSKQNDAFFNKMMKDLHLPEDFSTPLTMIYKDGDYYTHYEGAVPVEMVDHDIQQVIK